MADIRFGAVALDCDDPAGLADFWSALLGGNVVFSSENFVAVQAGSVWLTMHRVTGYRPPSWPAGDVPKQMHLDLGVDDLEGAEQQAIELGARRAEPQPAPDRWRVLLDPAGHPFCVTTQFPEDA